MNGCSATLTTATVTDESIRFLVNGDVVVEPLIDGTTVKRDGDRLLKVELHTLTCDAARNHLDEHFTGSTYWDDHTPGATPHTPVSTVTDAEVQAAFEVIYNSPRTTTSDHVRAALEAAAAVRAQEDDR